KVLLVTLWSIALFRATNTVRVAKIGASTRTPERTRRESHVQRYGSEKERKEEARENPQGKAGGQVREEEIQVMRQTCLPPILHRRPAGLSAWQTLMRACSPRACSDELWRCACSPYAAGLILLLAAMLPASAAEAPLMSEDARPPAVLEYDII